MWSSEVWVALCYLQAYMWQEGCHAVPQVCSWRGTCACWVTTGVQEVLPIGVRLLVFQVPSVPQRVDLWWQTHASCFDHQLSRWPRNPRQKVGYSGWPWAQNKGSGRHAGCPKGNQTLGAVEEVAAWASAVGKFDGPKADSHQFLIWMDRSLKTQVKLINL